MKRNRKGSVSMPGMAGMLMISLLAAVTSHSPSGENSLPAGVDDPGSPLQEVKLQQCQVSVIDDIDIPAREAGVLQELRVKEGTSVKAGELVASIEDQRARLQQTVAARQHDQAQLQAKNDVDVRYSKAASRVSHAEYEEAREANKISAGAVAAAEVRRLLLTSERSDLAIEQASMEHEVAGATEKMRAAELALAEHDIERRRLTVPVAGMVVEVAKHPGEWLQAGETVMRVVRMDRLRVEGFVDAAHFGDEEVVDCPVQVTVPRQRGQTETFTGKIVFVNPIIEAGGNYRVWAEVQNRQANGRWLLRPGMEAEMILMLTPMQSGEHRAPQVSTRQSQ
jgi:multidrug efflux pump subunit AcrA (membrane-fusion protein)